MLIAEMNWMQVEAYLEDDDRAVIPLGSTEQHGYLSLLVDTLIAERLAREAADPLGLPVFPAVSYGLSPYFSAFPGTVTLRLETFSRLLEDLLDSLSRSGFRRIAFINGHGGNAPAAALAQEWMGTHPGHQVKLYDWWTAPRTRARIEEIDPIGTHASWMENFPWTRLAGVRFPEEEKPAFDRALKSVLDPPALRQALGDGSYGGRYQRPDAEMMAIWSVAVQEAREFLEGGWK